MVKVSIIGTGKAGGLLSHCIASEPRIDSLTLVDIIEPLLKSTVLDLSHAYPEAHHKIKAGTYADVGDSDIVVMTAGVARNLPMETRLDLVQKNSEVYRQILSEIDFGDKTKVIVMTNPVEPLTYLTYKVTGLAAAQVIGFSNVVDSARLRYILSKESGVEASRVDAVVIGHHGEDMLPVFSQASVGGKRPAELGMDLLLVRDMLRESSKSVLEGLGVTMYGPAAHMTRVLDSMIHDKNDIFPLSHFIDSNDFYKIENACISLPVRIGKEGVTEIYDMKLSSSEQSELQSIQEKLKDVQASLVP